ncbi:MAG: hypothetical protein JNJ61_08560 [Anaerolineae bacterium]|nr:hypothetical protein [Anaerolineae bacterium]
MTQTQTIFTNEYATLMYHPENRIVHHIFHKPIGGEAFRQVLDTGLDTLKQHGASKWLSDDRQNAALPLEDTMWAITNWAPRVLAAGWKSWALIVPDSVSARINMAEFINDYGEKGVRIMIFADPNEAQQWLEKQAN